MTAKKGRASRLEPSYQHSIPQRDLDHEARPRDGVSLYGPRLVCRTCAKPLIIVDENDGPEMLKALLRF